MKGELAEELRPEADPRDDIRRWIRERLRGEETVHLPNVSVQAAEEFSRDTGYMARLARQVIYEVAYDEAQRQLARTRQPGDLTLDDQPVSREKFNRRAERHFAGFFSWMEHAGGVHRKMAKMYRPEVIDAAEEREKRSRKEAVRALYMRFVAAGMPDDYHTVEECYSKERLAELWDRACREIDG